MKYNDQWFEWVIGPGESFVSEPVLHYAFNGAVETTVSGTSKPLDRVVEKTFQEFLADIIGVAGDTENLPAPQWATWSHFRHNVNDQIMRNMADIAVACGFVQFELDDGWQRDQLGSEPDTVKFPDFDDTCRYVLSKGMRLGLWVSCFRDKQSKDLQAIPDGYSLPPVRRVSSTQDGYGMSFASSWRDYYVNDLVYLHDRYGATYYKQDFSNIRFGDIRLGHESRTKKESYLRALRGLLLAQDRMAKLVPDVTTEITHEIYWGTPGVPCDIAAIKSAKLFHIPPNDYSGCGPSYGDGTKPEQIRASLIQGCYNARQRLYEHRGLPLYVIEYYGAATYNYNGSLTTQVQDRQICSWLMGAQLVYSGDLSTLTQENISHYKQRFGILARLQKQYDIYRYFQFSGVPVPTDSDWHWWGKINTDGYGVVVVMRGNGGKEQRAVNIPWVVPQKRYKLTALFGEKELGTFKGSDLINGALKIALPKYGQEILEVKRKK